VTFLLVLALVAALAGYAFFNAAETAAFTLSSGDLAALKRARPGAGAAVERLLGDRRRVLTAVLLGNLFVSVLYFNIAQALATGLHGGAEFLFETGALTALIVLGEMLPKTLALRAPSAAAAATAFPLRAATVVLAVPGAVLAFLARGLRPLGGAETEDADLSPAELARLLEVAAKRGALGGDEHAWLRELVLLAEIRVKEAMTPRVAVVGFDLAGTREDFAALFAATRRNKIPVYRDSIDRLAGYIDAKEALRSDEPDLGAFVHPLGFIPESATAADALAELRRTGGRILAVVDEYGGFEGLVTREDLVECVFGDLADESDDEEHLVTQTGPGRFLVDAALPVTESRRAFGTAAGGAAATLGGLVSAALRRLPRVGDEVRLGRVVVRVASLKGRTAGKLFVRHVETPEAAEESER
jgi:CBS domain containing-hemolysin-like protein